MNLARSGNRLGPHNKVLQLTAPACHGPGIMVMKNGAASGRTDVETSSALESGQGRASPARS
jgi:hypothetical protein